MRSWFLLFFILTASLYSTHALGHVCPEGWFDCGNERCVAMFWVCDGENDCGNLMDEMDCDAPPESEICERHQYECRSSKRCIPRTWLCDGHLDCTDGADEMECGGNSTEVCDGFQCKDHICIPEKWKCDDQWDCSEGEDEEGCKIPPKCLETDFKCKDGSCLKEDKVCNGRKDCSEGEDEGKHCTEFLCRNMSCSHECHVEPTGARCFCRTGYKLADNKKSCNDINECQNSSTCSHRCVNTRGSFLCSCLPGYSLVSNTSCQADGAEPLLIFSSTKEIRGMWTRSQRYFPIARSKHQAVGVALDGVEKRIYWVETMITGGGIMSCSLDGSDIHPVLSTGLQHPEDVAVDWLARNLYITDSGLKQVLACKLEGSFCSAVVKEDIEKPRSIALDPKKGLMYWSDWGEHPGIFRAGMDGSFRSTLVGTDIVWPNGISLDFPTNRLYWCDGKTKRFESIGLDGKNRLLILQDKVFHPFSLSVFEDTLYWSDWASFSIDSCHKTTGRNQSLLLRSAGRQIMGIHVYHPVLLNERNNPCWSSRCSHLCLLSTTGFACACPAGYSLDSDRITCLPVRSSPFLLAAEENHLWHIHPESVGEDIVTELPLGKIYSVGDMAFDWATSTLYLSDIHEGAILALNTSTYRIRVFVNRNLDAVEALDFDWLGQNLYWVDAGTGLVEVASAKNASTRTTLIKHLVRPLDIALCPEKGIMYIVTTGGQPSLSACDMDGQNCHVLVSQKLGLPVSVAVESSLGRLFWTDARLGTVESTDFKGENRVKNQIRVGQVMSVASSESTLYWTDMDRHMIHYARHEAALGVLGMIRLPHDHNGSAIIRIAYFSPPPLRKMGPCATRNGGCSHLCLTNPLDFVCACPTGLELGLNKRLCREVEASLGCESNEFRCMKSGKCIPNIFQCDGSADCEDNSDELECKTSCPLGDFRCANGKCLLATWVCDKHNDCGDGSDEHNCSLPETCKSTQMACDNGYCISAMWKCDGDNDCQNGEDEKDCITECDQAEFQCKDGRCLPLLWQCDGDFDCPDKSDELNCGTRSSLCSSKEFRCGDGMCLDNKLRCDRQTDCEDGSDEANCKYETENCPEDMIMCNDQTCIFPYEKCDGFKDCPKGEDELDCTTSLNDCRTFEFYCQQSERCIPSTWTCDGMDDCGDNEDESLPKCVRSVSTTKATLLASCPSEFGCTSGDCVPWNKVCDDVPDCLDRSDEGNHCGTSCVNNNGDCGQKCRDTPLGAVCSCMEGFVLLKDGKTCDDVNECLVVGHCSQQCTNTRGGFKCTCLEGYRLSADGRRCKAEGGAAHLLVLLPEEISSTSLERNSRKVLVQGSETGLRSMDFDAKDNTLFWTEKHGSIHVLSNGHVTELVSNLHHALNLAYDWVTTNIYFSTLTSIDVCRRDGKYCGQVMSTENTVQSLALAPTEGFLFWSVWSIERRQSSGQIVRAPMDGGTGSGTPIISSKIDWPASLNVDPITRRLFWIDTRLHTIEVADLDGFNREVLVKEGTDYPFSLTLFEDYIFWADWGTRRIIRANKFTGGSTFALQHIKGHPQGLKILHSAIQPKGVNPCAEAQCPQLCLLKEIGYSCKCGYDFRLANGSRSCALLVNLDINNGELVPAPRCNASSCKNGGECEEKGNKLHCKCSTDYRGPKCEYKTSDDDTEEPDYTWVAGTILGSLAVLLFLLISVLICKRYSRNIRTIGETVQATFPNPLFDLLPKSDRLVVDNDEVSGEDTSLGKGATYKKVASSGLPDHTYIRNTEGRLNELYRSVSSDSVDSTFVSDKENLGRSLLTTNSDHPVRYTSTVRKC